MDTYEQPSTRQFRRSIPISPFNSASIISTRSSFSFLHHDPQAHPIRPKSLGGNPSPLLTFLIRASVSRPCARSKHPSPTNFTSTTMHVSCPPIRTPSFSYDLSCRGANFSSFASQRLLLQSKRKKDWHGGCMCYQRAMYVKSCSHRSLKVLRKRKHMQLRDESLKAT